MIKKNTTSIVMMRMMTEKNANQTCKNGLVSLEYFSIRGFYLEIWQSLWIQKRSHILQDFVSCPLLQPLQLLVLPLFASHDLSELYESDAHLESSILGKPAALWLPQVAKKKEKFPSISPSTFHLLGFGKSLKINPSIKMDTGIHTTTNALFTRMQRSLLFLTVD
jgi:hypothetical protein